MKLKLAWECIYLTVYLIQPNLAETNHDGEWMTVENFGENGTEPSIKKLNGDFFVQLSSSNFQTTSYFHPPTF